ncbi:kinase-like domain-containing protein [Parasitella parasitica]|nr:kinase-like domain-containing protein [Parasitella parasitica]
MGALCCKQDEIDYSLGPELGHFHLQKIIGKGVFGKVRIVQHKRTKKKYALKYIDKSLCIKQRAIGNIVLERNILERIDYPLIANLRYAFQDDETIFMALDLMLGGDLRFQLDQQFTFHELQVRHIVASVALSLNYLHTKRIAHRDIKPENILLDKKGYAHLSDFNIAIEFTPSQPFVWSMAGTMAYMAPEMLARKGYSIAVDWWSLGTVTYELLFGMRPYLAQSKEALAQAIIHEPLVFPNHVYDSVSKECIDVISGLLDKSPFHRYGCNFQDFKSHPWFHEQQQRYQEDGLKSHRRVSPVRTSLGAFSPVTEEARSRMQLEDQFADFDFTQHQMVEGGQDPFRHFFEQRRNSLKRQYDRFKRRSQCSYQDLPISPPYSD